VATYFDFKEFLKEEERTPEQKELDIMIQLLKQNPALAKDFFKENYPEEFI